MRPTVPAPGGLGEMSRALQSLHKSLLDHQADRSGFFGGPLELFDRATKDTDFAWLKPLRVTIVALDTRLANTEPVSGSEATALAARVGGLIDAPSGLFRAHLNAALQSHPDVAMALGAVQRALAVSRPKIA